MSEGNNNITIGQLAETINNKMDRDGLNANTSWIFVVSKQDPTPENGYTWYRKYSDGWVECGMPYSWNGAWTTISLPVAMRDANSYTCTCGGFRTDSSPYQQITCFRNYTATTVDIWSSDDTTSNPASVRIYICGIAA